MVVSAIDRVEWVTVFKVALPQVKHSAMQVRHPRMSLIGQSRDSI